MKNYWTIGIMAALGMILGKLLLPVLGNYIENHNINKVANSQLKEYIENSSELDFPFKSYQYSESYYKENFMYKGPPFAPYNHYQESVFYHLTYFTPKEQFQKMFPEQK